MTQALERIENNQREQRAILVAVYNGAAQRPICEEHLEELELLCETYGVKAIKKIPCQVKKFDASTFLSKGKLEDLTLEIKNLNPDIVIFDDEISPAQQRNLEKLFQIPVIDRTEVILGVFAQRAHSKEAHLQVELAQIKYQAPRLKRMWTHLSRQHATGGGGGAYLKGKGEKQIEIDRRMIKQRTHQIQKEIDEVKSQRDIRRNLRVKTEVPTFAIIGYTNAGKSTLLNSLTEAGVFVEDKLFATLDTTTRKFTLSNNQEILLTDTVGFIRKLPHFLVAAFRSTLEEAIQSDILLHLIDISHPMAEEQAEATFEVLKELGAEKKQMITVLNKIDLCNNQSMINRMRIKYPKTVQISALNKLGFEELVGAMEEELRKQRELLQLRIPQKDYHVISEIISMGNVLKQEYEENDILLKVELPASLARRVQNYIQKADEK